MLQAGTTFCLFAGFLSVISFNILILYVASIDIILQFTSGNDKAQRYLLGAFERLVGVKYHDKLISKTRPILKVIFDLDLVDEETLLEWSKKVMHCSISAQ